MKTRLNGSMRRLLSLLLVIAIVIAAAGIGYYLFNKQKDGCELILYGNVDIRQVDIAFRVPGQIIQLNFEEGDCVSKGELIAKLDATPYISQLAQARANAMQTRVNLGNAEQLVKRRQELIGIGGVSQEDLDDAITRRDALHASIAAADASVEIAKDNLSYIEAFAPADGIILTRIREPGTVVNSSDPVCTISLSTPIWIRAYVNEVDLGKINFGMPADVYIDTPNAPIYKGKVGFISPVAEFTPKTVQTAHLRTDLVYRLRIYVDCPDRFLKQGMPVTVKMQLNSAP